MPTDASVDIKAASVYKQWTSEIQDALRREKVYRQKGQKIVDLYEAKKPEETPFAILYSNAEVLQPAVYNQRPVPIVTRRHKDADPIGKVAGEVSTRLLKYLIDVDTQDYDTYDELMQTACLNAIITNRGLTRFRFVAQDNNYECVHGEAVRWDKFFHGYARTWKKVPWIGFEWDMSEEELRKNFPDVVIDLKSVDGYDPTEDSPSSESKDELTGVTLYKVYEIWDKRSRTVKFFSPVYPRGPLKQVEDPLGLVGFFPCPQPLNFTRKVTTLLPTPLYEHYRSQAQELNEITRRLKAIIRAIKYRGAYNSAVEGIEKMLSADDNSLVPVENVQSMPDGTGLDKLLWIVPVQELAATAQQLYMQREQVKQVIYEITGISDILRGASVASETATAQNLKNQWGSLRLKKMQKEVQRYCRDSLAIMLEIAATKFEPETIKAMTGLPYLFQGQKQQIAQGLELAQAMGQQPPALPPEIQAALKQPSWEEILGLLRNDILRNYKTDIETNSTIDAEASQDKQDISELLNGLSQFLNGLGPLVQNGILPFSIAKDMLLVIARRYNFGSQLEDNLLALEEPKPQEDPSAQIEAQAKQAEMQLKMQEAQQQAAISAQEHQQALQLMQAKAQLAAEELALKREELAMQREMLRLKMASEQARHNMKLQQLSASKTSEKSNAAV